MIDRQALAAFGAIDDPREQPARIGSQGILPAFADVLSPFLYQINGPIEIVIIHDSKLLDGLGKGIAEVHLAAVDGIPDHGPDGCGPPQRRAALGLYAALIEPVCNAVPAVAFVHDLVIDLGLDRGFFFIAY